MSPPTAGFPFHTDNSCKRELVPFQAHPDNFIKEIYSSVNTPKIEDLGTRSLDTEFKALDFEFGQLLKLCIEILIL